MEITKHDLDSLIKLADQLKTQLEQLKEQPKAKPTTEPPKVAPKPVVEAAGSEFDQLVQLLESKAWPLAVPQDMICDPNSEEEKVERAQSILNYWLHHKNQSILDYGCGEGHIVREAAKKGKAVGYDIVSHESWDENCSTDFSKIVEQGPYQTILLYDVLDHVENESPVDVLKKAKSVLANNGSIHLRMHPWCGRHGTHSYQSKNKAYIHLVFTPEELDKLSINYLPHQKVIHPIYQYNEWINEAGLKKKSEEYIERTPVERFFQSNELVRKRIQAHWKNSRDKSISEQGKFPEFQLNLTFLDFEVM